MKPNIENALREMIMYLIKTDEKINAESLEIRTPLIESAVKKGALFIQEEYDKILKLNDKENYFNLVIDIVADKKCNVVDAWEEVEDLLAEYKQKPMFTSVNSFFNAQSKFRKNGSRFKK